MNWNRDRKCPETVEQEETSRIAGKVEEKRRIKSGNGSVMRWRRHWRRRWPKAPKYWLPGPDSGY